MTTTQRDRLVGLLGKLEKRAAKYAAKIQKGGVKASPLITALGAIEDVAAKQSRAVREAFDAHRKAYPEGAAKPKGKPKKAPAKKSAGKATKQSKPASVPKPSEPVIQAKAA